jgi:hypothetical protein
LRVLLTGGFLSFGEFSGHGDRVAYGFWASPRVGGDRIWGRC